MNEQIREQLSALYDGELPAVEHALLLERLARDPALRAHWSQYQLVGDGLRNTLPEQVDLGLAARVMHAIEATPIMPVVVRSSPLLRVLRPLAGLAVAASVAVVAVLAVQQVRTPAPALEVAANLPAAPAPQAYIRVQGTRWDAQRGSVQPPQVGNRLNEYLVNHSEYATSGGMPGMQPYVRIVGYDQE